MKQKSLISVILTVFIAFSSVFCVHAEESGEKIRVMPLGDSITDGFSTVGGYRQPLCNKLEENGYSGNFDFVGPNWGGNCYDPQHAGYSGYSIDNIDQADSQERVFQALLTGLWTLILLTLSCFKSVQTIF